MVRIFRNILAASYFLDRGTIIRNVKRQGNVLTGQFWDKDNPGQVSNVEIVLDVPNLKYSLFVSNPSGAGSTSRGMNLTYAKGWESLLSTAKLPIAA